MDYVEAFMAIAESLSDLRRRVISLEAQGDHDRGGSSLVEQIDELRTRLDGIDIAEYVTREQAEEIADTQIEQADFEEHVKNAIRYMTFTIEVK